MHKNLTLAFISTIFILANTTHAMDYHTLYGDKARLYKTLGIVQQSMPVYMFNKLLIKQSPLDQGATSFNTIKQLGTSAQAAVGIPLEDQVPVLFSFSLPRDISAAARPEAIYTNIINMYMESYGAQRSILMHEAIHVKYHDHAFFLLAKIIMPLAVSGTTYFTNGALLRILGISPKTKMSRLLRALWSIGIGSQFPTYNQEKDLITLCERRADTEGLYATECYTCVSDFSKFRRANEPEEYISHNEVIKIRDTLFNANKQCEIHKQENNLSGLKNHKKE